MWTEAGSRAQSTGEAAKHMSHSTVEKQRRDRINSLIDELREIVPPRATNGALESGDSKRPKHTVLSDTIALVKQLQYEGVNSSAQHNSYATAADTLRQTELHLPLAPDGAAPAFGMVVEESADCLYVKVHCKNRDRLLLDIASALAELQLQVLSAAVTTTREGNVFDVLRVHWSSSHAVTPQILQQTLLTKLLPCI